MADWPHFRGPERNGISSEPAPARLPAGGPRTLWEAKIGEGYATVAVAAGRAYAAGNYSGQDYVSCIDVATGKVKWQHKHPCGAGDYGGPRATPAVAGGRVFTLSREGVVFCLDAASGKVLWRKDVARETGAPTPQWGFAGSPTVLGNRLYLNVGAAGSALDTASGRIVWASRGGPSGYASVVPFQNGSQTALGVFAGTALIAVDPASGRRLWEFGWQTSYDVNAADPIFSGDSVFISSNYGKGGALLRFAGGRPNQVWFSRSMKNHFNTSVLVGGLLFGNDENTLRCLDWRTGAERWSMRGMGKGGLIAAGGRLLALTERGELVLANAGPRFEELGRAQVLDGTCWSQPTLSDGRLFCRNHEGRLVCLALGRA